MKEIYQAEIENALDSIFTERGIIEIIYKYFYQEYIVVDYIGNYESPYKIKSGLFYNTQCEINWMTVWDFNSVENPNVSSLPYNDQSYLYQFTFYDFSEESPLRDLFIKMSGKEPTQEIELLLSNIELDQQELDSDDMEGFYIIAFLKAKKYFVVDYDETFSSKYSITAGSFDDYTNWYIVYKFDHSDHSKFSELPYNDEEYVYSFTFDDYSERSTMANLFFDLAGRYPTKKNEVVLSNVDLEGFDQEDSGGSFIMVCL